MSLNDTNLSILPKAGRSFSIAECPALKVVAQVVPVQVSGSALFSTTDRSDRVESEQSCSCAITYIITASTAHTPVLQEASYTISATRTLHGCRVVRTYLQQSLTSQYDVGGVGHCHHVNDVHISQEESAVAKVPHQHFS
eukprot:gene9234-1519_t